MSEKTPLAAALFSEIFIADQLARNRLAKALPKGMEISHFSVLNHLAHLGDERSPAQLAKIFHVTRGAMTNTLNRLEWAGHVHIRPDWEDARRKKVSISPGRAGGLRRGDRCDRADPGRRGRTDRGRPGPRRAAGAARTAPAAGRRLGVPMGTGTTFSLVRDGGTVASIVPVPDGANPGDRVKNHQIGAHPDGAVLAQPAAAAGPTKPVFGLP